MFESAPPAYRQSRIPDSRADARRFGGLVAALLLLVALPGGAALAQSDGRATVRGFVDAINSGEAETLLSFMRQRFAPSLFERRPEQGWSMIAQQLVQDLPPFEPSDVRRDGDEVVVQGRTGDGTAVTMSLTLDEEARIAGMGIELGGHEPPSDLPAPEVSRALAPRELAERLDAWLDLLEERIGFTGSVAVALDGETVFESARGLASRRFEVSNTLETRYDVGSINKSFTRVAVGQLMAAGKLSSDDTIADHLPAYPDPEIARKITVQQLLDHTSGLGDIFGPEFARSSKALYTTPESFFPLFAEQPLLFEPGEGRSYSNAGFQVLGAIVAAASGQSYHDYVRQNVFEKAGMSADFLRIDEPWPNVAIGYTDADLDGSNPEGRIRSVHFLLPVIGSPAGSSFASARDLLLFDDALREGRLLPAGWSHWYFNGVTSAEEPDRLEGEEFAIGVAGGAPGVSADLESDGSLAVAVLCNWGDGMAESVAQGLYRALQP